MNCCYYCETPLTRLNSSQEHVIPNAIGGQLKSYKLLCKPCNEQLGGTVDAEFAKQFDSICALLSLERDRPKNYIIKNVKTADGVRYNLEDGRNPVRVQPIILEHEHGINITVNGEKQLKQVITGLQRKYPNLDIIGLKEKMRYNEYLFGERLNIDLNTGGETFLKAVAKTAVNVYLYFGGDRANIKSMLEVIKGNIANDKYIHFHLSPACELWTEDEVVHWISIKGSSSNRILYAYVVLFSAFAFIVNMDDNYTGADFENSYGYDVIGRKKVNKAFPFNYDGRNNYLKPLNAADEQEVNRKIINSIQANLDRVMLISQLRQRRKTMTEVMVKAQQEVFSKYPSGTLITEQIVDELVNAASPRLAQLWIHWNTDSNSEKHESKT